MNLLHILVLGEKIMKEKAGKKRSSLLTTLSGKRIISGLIGFALALITASASVFPGVYPFGIASVSAASGILAVTAALTGALIGSAFIPKAGGVCAAMITVLAVTRAVLSRWFRSDPDSRLPVKAGENNGMNPKKFIAAFFRNPSAALRSLASVSSGGTMLRENIRVRLALSACTALFVGAWSVAEGGFGYYDLFGAVFSLLFTPVVTYLFYAARERKMRYSPIREIAVYFTAAAVTLSLSSFSHGGLDGLHETILHGAGKPVFDLGVLFAFAAAVIAATEAGIHRGALLGLACGMVMQPSFAPAYAIAAVAAGSFAGVSSTFAVLMGGVCASAWSVYAAGFDGLTGVFVPVTTASAVLIPLYRFGYIRLPGTIFGTQLFGAGSRGNSAAGAMAEAVLGGMKKKIGALSDGMMSLSAVLGGMADKLTRPCRAEYEEITNSAFDVYCGTCRNRERCHEAKISKIEPIIQRMTDELVRDGAVTAGTVPTSLASSCWNMGRILDEINLMAGKKIAEKKRGDKLAVSSADYSLCGELMKQAARAEAAEAETDEKMSSKLRRVLSYHNFGAGAVTVYGEREKHIFVSDVDLTVTRMGADDIRKLFESITGFPLSQPEFELNGASLSMRMSSVTKYGCTSGMFSCAASQVQVYRQDAIDCGADSHDEDGAAEERALVPGFEESEVPKEAEEEKITVTVSSKAPEGICGDGMSAFEYGGKYYMILSDGMGSGREAALTSGVVVSMLEKLICAGAELETALKMLNHIIRTVERECSATVDIAEIDLVTGEARFIKSGAAPSFVLRGGSIFRLQSKTVPIGIIRALDAEMIKFDVEEGDTVVMVSDGAAKSYEDAPWLLELMTYDETVLHGDERRAAMTIVSEAAIRGSEDDISAGIVRIRRKAG